MLKGGFNIEFTNPVERKWILLQEINDFSTYKSSAEDKSFERVVSIWLGVVLQYYTTKLEEMLQPDIQTFNKCDRKCLKTIHIINSYAGNHLGDIIQILHVAR